MERLSHFFFDYNMRVTVDWRDDRVKGKERRRRTMVKLEIMNEDEYNAYISLSTEEHINELVEEENLSLEEANEAAKNDLLDMLPEGLYTDSNYIMKIVDDSMKQTVGFIWTLHEFHEGKKQSFICELGIYDQYRRNGYEQLRILLGKISVNKVYYL